MIWIQQRAFVWMLLFDSLPSNVIGNEQAYSMGGLRSRGVNSKWGFGV